MIALNFQAPSAPLSWHLAVSMSVRRLGSGGGKIDDHDMRSVVLRHMFYNRFHKQIMYVFVYIYIHMYIHIIYAKTNKYIYIICIYIYISVSWNGRAQGRLVAYIYRYIYSFI
jgi:hypothetical protein